MQQKAMSNSRRFIIAMLSPPLLGAIIIACMGRTAPTVHETIWTFPFFLLFAYGFGIVPSSVYALIMEFWFSTGFHRRCGPLCTVALSLSLGGICGFFIQIFVFANGVTYMLPVGAIVGLIVGWWLEASSQ